MIPRLPHKVILLSHNLAFQICDNNYRLSGPALSNFVYFFNVHTRTRENTHVGEISHTYNTTIIIMTGKGKGKRSRKQTNKGGSGVSPPEKRTSRAARKKNNTIQATISEWVMDDDDTHSRLTHEHINNDHMLPTKPSTSHTLPANRPHTYELPASRFLI